jgi:hypothetical protein
MALEVVQKRRPVERQALLLKVPEGKGEAMVDADERWSGFGKQCRQPLGNSLAGPISAGMRAGAKLGHSAPRERRPAAE